MQAAENRPQQLPLCRQLQQQLAMELSRLPRMASEPESQLESAVPVMVQLPQLIVSVLMAIVEQHAAEQVMKTANSRTCNLYILVHSHSRS